MRHEEPADNLEAQRIRVASLRLRWRLRHSGDLAIDILKSLDAAKSGGTGSLKRIEPNARALRSSLKDLLPGVEHLRQRMSSWIAKRPEPTLSLYVEPAPLFVIVGAESKKASCCATHSFIART